MAVFTTTPVMGIDISHWDYGIDVPLLLEAGVKAFVVKIGQNSILDSNFYKHAANISKYTAQGAILMCYYWDEITQSSTTQVDWLTKEIARSGFPITFTWLDDEQWWTNWAAWYKAKAGSLAWSAVPAADKSKLSIHFYNTYMALKASLGYDRCGIYSSNGFMAEHAPPMVKWFASEKVKMWIPYYGWQSQPRTATRMTWNIWRTNWYPNYTPRIPVGSSYDDMKGHQCTGDVCIVPGIWQDILKRPIAADINIFDGTWLASITDGVFPPIPPKPPENRYVALYTLNEYPTSAHTPPVIGYLPVNTECVVYEVVGNYARIKDPVVNGKALWVYYPYLQKV